MTQKKQELTINFGIKKISILDYAVESSTINIDPKQANKYDFNFELGFAVDQKNKIIKFILNFNVNPENDKTHIVGKQKIEVQFFITNIEELLLPEQSKINLPEMFMSSMIGIVISTARGIWAAKVMGTKLEPAILPLMSPAVFLEGLNKSKTSA